MNLALRAARSRPGGAVLRLIFAYCSFLLPVRKVFNSGELLGFYHPRPSYPFHVLIVPKRWAASLGDLEEIELARLGTAAFRAGQKISAELDAGRTELVVNAGEFQDVRQVHFHLIRRGKK